MIQHIFVEQDCLTDPITQNILQSFAQTPMSTIEEIDQYWGRVKKPYLQKRTNLNLFIGKKRGQLVKEAPDAYGVSGEKHFYFIHAYNCIYECSYCYLQGYFATPDLVIFINHEEIRSQMQHIIMQYPNSWFHAGEFSDSLALHHITREWEDYFKFFAQFPLAKLELRTKSSNIALLEKLIPLKNIFISFSLSPESAVKDLDLKTPALSSRLRAMQKLHAQGHQVAIHLDPIVYHPQFLEHYEVMMKALALHVPLEDLHYISMGVARYTKKVYREVQRNYPKASLHFYEQETSFDGKIRYPENMRRWMLGSIKNLLISHGIEEKKIYACME